MVGKITSNKKLSASRIAVAMNEHPSQEPNDVFNDVCDAIAGIPKKEITDIRLLELFAMGNEAETLVAKQVAEFFHLHLDDKITRVYRWEEADIEASLDAILTPKNGSITVTNRVDVFPEIRLAQGQTSLEIDKPFNLEIKTRQGHPYEDLPWWLGKGQAMVQAKCAGFDICAVAVRYNGNQTIVYFYEVDAIYIKRVLAAAKEFYHRVHNKTPYPSRTAAGAARTFGSVNEEEEPMIFDGKAKDLVEQYYDAERAIKALTVRKKELEPMIMDIMRDQKAGVLTDDLGNEIAKVTWPLRRTRATPERIIPAKEAKEERQKTLTIKADWNAV
tara:strand:+ start:1204 stop:2196 length:993 start_codon:yes stop_codon:yes gene_type:complete